MKLIIIGIIVIIVIIYLYNWYINYYNKNLLEPKSIHGNQVLKNHLVTISKLSHENKAYIFPRMGFLLGVIRHNGFLPNEGIDADLACIEKDIPKILESDWG